MKQSMMCMLVALAGLVAPAQAALVQAQPEAPAVPAAEDTTRWRYFLTTPQMGVMVTDEVLGNERRTLSSYTVLAQPQSGVDGFLTRFEVNCDTNQITDLGGTAYSGATERGTIPSRTNGQAIIVEAQTVYESIHTYACNRRYPSGGGRLITGRAAAIDYVRGRMSRN